MSPDEASLGGDLFGQAGDSTPEHGEGRVNGARPVALFYLSVFCLLGWDFTPAPGNGTITQLIVM
ncbi:hypothetical protein [Streptacidiphilus sp. PAMC 29251]